MQKYQDVVLKPNGDVVSYGFVTVKNYPSGTTATIYSDNGATAIANPVTCDAYGNFAFYAANGTYNLTFSGTGFTSTTKTNVILYDPSDTFPGNVTLTSLNNTPIGNTTPSTGAFTTLAASGETSLNTLTASGAATLTNLVYTPAGTGAVATTVQTKLRESVSVSDFAGATDLAKVNAALAAVSPGGTLLFDRIYTCTAKLDIITGKSGIRLKSVSASHAGSPQAAGLLFTCSGISTDKLVNFTSCENIDLSEMDIRYNNAAFVGTVVALPNSARCSGMRICIGGVGVTTAAVLLDLGTAIGCTFTRSTFSGAAILVSGGGGSNGNTLLGCNYDRYTDTAIYRPNQAWTIISGFCENRVDTTGKFIRTENADDIYGLTVKGVWMGDAISASAFAWISLGKPKGLDISGNYINGTGALNATAVNIAGASSGVVVKANYFGSLGTGVNLNGACASYDIGPNTVTAGCTEVVGILQQSVGSGVVGTKVIRTGSSGVYLEYPAYGAVVAIDASAGDNHVILVTNGTAYTISNPSNANGSQVISIKIVNISGGAMGAITWGANYRMAAWTNPAIATSRTIDFVYNGAVWVEKSRTPADIPN